jgi:2-amino-4-hydroxy-6-hydroxymethyldihydropteridine diphosphokinase
MNTPVWIGLGSNLGDRKGILDAAVDALTETPGVVVRAVSSYHETRAVGGPTGQGAFLNASAYLETTLGPYQLLAAMQAIENQAGRVRTVRWGERTLDLDILIFGTKFIDDKELRLPHPRLALRRFVLAPLAEIAPKVVDVVTKRTISELLANLDRRPRLLAIDGFDGRRKASVFRRLVEELPGFGVAGKDLVGGSFEILERKAEALRASLWAVESLRVPWIVTDYFLGLDLLRASTSRAWKEDGSLDQKAKMDAHRGGMQRARLAARAALMPNLIVVLPNQPAHLRRPGLLKIPQLWPESDKPDAIVAEVLATCRSIEGV